jgi:gliding motility-associated-like protein
MKRAVRFFFLGISGLVASMGIKAQVPNVLISQGGTQTYCNVNFFDSGGPNGSYGNNENQVITFCPGNPGDSMQISFTDLQIAPGDALNIYAGSSTSSPLMDTYPGTLVTGALYTSTDPSGCLTIQFTSNNLGTMAGWAASLQCTSPCAAPTADFPAFPESPYRLCPYDTLTLDASSSYAAPGRTIASYAWTIAGTTTYSSDPSITLPLSTSGQYPILLEVTDDIGCANTNSSSELVRVGTRADFSGSGITPSTICAGESVTLHGSGQGTLWSSVPEPIVSGLVLLPDGCPPPGTYTGTINVSGFPAGTVISNLDDIVQFCLNMEHSYLGDLTVSLACPGGQSVLLFAGYGGGGGGTYLGSPDDYSTGIPGVGAEYCFSMNAPWGTIVANNNASHWVTAGTPPGNSMAPGTYTPQQSFSQWYGCPLNGPWTLTVTDNLCIDDGFIFGMSMSINSSLYPDVVEFTPAVGQGCDSSSWSGPGITFSGADCRTGTVTPTSPGSYPYTYTVTDDFGCTYDSTFTFTVTPGVNVDPTASLVQCGQPLLLNPGLQLPLPTGQINYQWSPAAGLSSTSSAFPTASPTVPTWYTLHAFPAGHPLCGNVDSVLVNPLTTLANDSLVTDHLCHGDNLGSIQVITTGTGGPWNYVWTDSTGTVVQSTNASNGDQYHGAGGTYQVLIAEGANGNGCTDSLTATILEPSALLIDSIVEDTLICRTGTADLYATTTGGTGASVLHWNPGATVGDTIQVSPLQTTVYSVHATDANNCLSDTGTVTVHVRPGLQLFVADTVTSCPEVNALLSTDSVFGGDGQYLYDWGNGPFATDTQTVNLTHTQTFCVTLHDGCETPPVTECTTVKIMPLPPFVLLTDTILGCKPFLVHFAVQDTTGGATVDWNFYDGPLLNGYPTSLPHLYSRFGTYDLGVNVHWPNGCAFDSTLSGLITVVDMPHADFTWNPDPADIFEHEVHFTEQCGPTASSYFWDFAGMANSTATDTSINFPDDIGRYYPVKLVARNYLGCADSVTKMVNVDDHFLVYIPTAFTPDGDGLNEVLYVTGNDIADQDFHFMVFDRWGEKIFDSTDRHAGWDGKMNGKTVKNGVYTWMLRAKSVYTGVSRDLIGHVTVVR